MTYEIYRYIFIGAAIVSGILLAVSVILFFTLKIPRVISDLTGRTARRAIEDIRRQNEASGSKNYRPSSVNLRRGKVTDKISRSGRIQHPVSASFGGVNSTQKIPTQGLKGRSQKMPTQGLKGKSRQMPQQPYVGQPQQGYQGEVTTVLPETDATTILPENNVTTVLPENNQTTVLPENNVTTVLPENNLTTVLPENQSTAPVQPPVQVPAPAQTAPETTILPGTSETTVLYAGNDTTVLYAPQQAGVVDPGQAFSVELEITFIHTNEVIRAEGSYGA